MEKKGRKISGKKNIFVLMIVLFLLYSYDFLALKGYQSNIATILFKMIIVLFIMFGIIHKNEMKEMAYQTYLEDYFKKVK